jgi:hypothetical protein
MHFMRGLNQTFEPRCAVLLAQPKIPSLEETISAMVQEESRIRLQSGAVGLPEVKSALAVSKPGNIWYQSQNPRLATTFIVHLSLTLTYHLYMEHSLHLWILSLSLSVGRLLRIIQSGKLSC